MVALTSRLALGFWLFVSSPLLAQENLAFKPPSSWELGGPPQQTKDRLLMEFVKKGDTLTNWTELLTVDQVKRDKKSPQTYHAALEGLKSTWEQRCPRLTEWQILDEADGLFVYEWRTTGPCGGHPPQTELVRLMFGKKTGYRVGYNIRGELTAEMRATWLEWLRNLRLVR